MGTCIRRHRKRLVGAFERGQQTRRTEKSSHRTAAPSVFRSGTLPVARQVATIRSAGTSRARCVTMAWPSWPEAPVTTNMSISRMMRGDTQVVQRGLLIPRWPIGTVIGADGPATQTELASATESAPVGMRMGDDGSTTARHVASATSCE